jgi:hypothetical protein
MRNLSFTARSPLALVCSLSLLLTSLVIAMAQDLDVSTGATELPSANAKANGDALPEEARKLLDKLNATQSGNLERRIRQTESSLRPIQDTYTIRGKLDEAAAVRDAILELRARLANAFTDPGRLPTLRGANGQSFLFFIPCDRGGSVWGNNPYTDDSRLGTAAIHAGLVFAGRKGFLKVTIQPGRAAYEGVERNGVKSSNYASWEGSYVVEAADPRIRSGWDALPQSASRVLGEIDALKPTPDYATRKERLIARLKTLQDSNARAGRLDEALAIREAIKLYTVGQPQDSIPAVRTEGGLEEPRGPGGLLRDGGR